MVFFLRVLLALCAAMLLIQLELVEYSHLLYSIYTQKDKKSTVFILNSFRFHFQSHRGDYGVTLLFMALDATESFTLIFICCELGERFNAAFKDFDDIIDQFKWYLFSTELKRILPMIMIISQEPVTLECFGSIACCRVVFRKVC